MSPRLRPLALAATLCPFVLAPAGCGGEAGPPPRTGPPQHVLLIVVDTLRADHLSCYGYWRETSPNMDAVAATGVRFEQSIAQSSWTAPSMVTMMTGQRVQQDRLHVEDDKPTLAELFRDAGFNTAAWSANELLNSKNGFDRGFQRFTDEKGWHDEIKPSGSLEPIFAWLDENKGKDTFTWVHFTDPHDPYEPPARFRSGQLGRLTDFHEAQLRKAAEKGGTLDSLEEDMAEVARLMGLYDDEIQSVDAKIGELIGRLEQNGDLDNAVVVITSDHGECLWQRIESDARFEARREMNKHRPMIQELLKGTHGDFVYQELVRVPLIIMAPSLGRGVVEETVMEHVNMPSSILSLADVQVAGMDQMTGRNLWGDDVPPGAYSMTALGESFVDDDGWKLILPTELGRFDYGQPVQLYDLNADPPESNNLASQHPDRVREMTARIEERRRTALPVLSTDELMERQRANQSEIEKLGYAGGHLDHDHSAGAAASDALKGSWRASISGEPAPRLGDAFTLMFGSVEGRLRGYLEAAESQGRMRALDFDAASGELSFTFLEGGVRLDFTGRLAEGAIEGRITIEADGFEARFKAEPIVQAARESAPVGAGQ